MLFASTQPFVNKCILRINSLFFGILVPFKYRYAAGIEQPIPIAISATRKPSFLRNSSKVILSIIHNYPKWIIIASYFYPVWVWRFPMFDSICHSYGHKNAT